jgi:hypothetical protein
MDRLNFTVPVSTLAEQILVLVPSPAAFHAWSELGHLWSMSMVTTPSHVLVTEK